MAVDLFLKIKEIPGECRKKGHDGEIDILSFQFGVHQTGKFQTGGTGGGAGKAEFQDIHIIKEIDKSSPKLFQASASGKHIPTVLLTSQKAGESALQYYNIELGDVLISSVTNSGASGGDAITESLTLNCARIKFTYVEQTAQGGAGGKSEAGWDIGVNQAI